MSEEVKFWILLGRELVSVSADPQDPLCWLFTRFRRDPHLAKRIPPKVSYNNCTFYRLNNPVSMLTEDDSHSADDFLRQVKQACLEESNMVLAGPLLTRVTRLAEAFSPDHVYLVIEFPKAFLDSDDAIDNLRQQHGALFQCLQVKVQALDAWHREDVKENLQGGRLARSIQQFPDALKEIHVALKRKRSYSEPANAAMNLDYKNARLYNIAEFRRVFEDTNGSPTVINDREFAAFYNLLRCFDQDVERIAYDTSSSFRAGNFTVHFVQPPFFSEIDDDFRSFQYRQEKSWGFPLFVRDTDAPKASRKFTPKSDWMVISPEYRIPFVISKVISLKGETDRFRMLLEAIAVARAGQFLMKSGSTKRFFVVAINLNSKLIVSRYILMPRNANPENSPVDIYQEDFDLKLVNERVNFLCEMYNLATQIIILSDELDEEKKDSLAAIKTVASKVLSLSPTEHETRSTHQDGDAMEYTTESSTGSSWLQDEDGPSVFEAEDIQNVLRQMNHKIRFVVWGHPHLAVISNKSNKTAGYLKFVERENEVKVLRYLSEIKSPSNYTINGARFWPVQGGTLISMPVAGGWLTSLENPNKELWSVALQLVEAVAFMHEHNVAHMDLKPQNIIIPVKGGRLSIVDFSVSTRVSGPDATSNRVVGTEDYIAPEVRKGKYKPMLADLWSCGRTLEKLCACCGPSEERTKVLEIARSLMKDDPEARPKMSTVLERMSLAGRGD